MILFFRILPVLIALLCFIIGSVPQRIRSIHSPVFTDAEIVGSVSQKVFQKHSESLSFAPVVRYPAELGEITATSRIFVPEWQYHYRPGDHVRICYEKSNPGIFCILNDSRFRFRKLLCFTVGISILIAYGILSIQYL